jgi:glutamate carboxypeptidase
MKTSPTLRLSAVFFFVLFLTSAFAADSPNAALLAAAQQEQPQVINTLRDLVAMETGSGLGEGLSQSAAYLKQRLEKLGAKVTLVPLTTGTGTNVIGRFEGTGKVKIMLQAHQDTVYPAGTIARKPFRIDGTRAIGPGIADDKSGIANILHTLVLLQRAGFHNYQRLTVLFNADEEVGSPGSNRLITETAAEHDYVFSCEPGEDGGNGLAMATSGIGIAQMEVTGRASHAGVAPEAGRNALVELAYQILQTSDLSQPATGLKLSWTLATAGDKRNIIPESAKATADIRVWKNSQYQEIQQALDERTAKHHVPDTKVKVTVIPGRPAFESKPEAVKLAAVAKKFYAEAGQNLVYSPEPWGGGTDAAYAALSGKPVVLEGLGFVGFNYHSSNDEYIVLNSIAPRLYLLSSLVMYVGQ